LGRAKKSGTEAMPAPARALLVAGKPRREPIAQYGPFVMNSRQEIYQALHDFRDGRLGEPAR
jgi:redox-sensitive bicupin YhaK (pirin superfamily)